MGKPARLRLGQVRKAFRLLGEIREVGHDPALWREHMVRSLTELIGAQIATSAELPLPLNWCVQPIGRPGFVCHGFGSASQREQWLASGNSSEHGSNPLAPAVARIRHRSFTRCRQQLLDDSDWYSSRWVNVHARAMGMDDSLLSHQVLPEAGCIHSIWLHRPWGERNFTQADVRLLHLFHAELARLWRQRSMMPGPDRETLASLSPRLCQTLDRLLRGESEKQIARFLGLSRHTVHKYVGMLHRRFAVCSNTELLARFVGSGARSAPWLASQQAWPGRRPPRCGT